MRDDFTLVQLLKTLHDRQDDSDDNSFDNTVIQFFEAPHDTSTLTALTQTFVNGASIPANVSDKSTLRMQFMNIVNNPNDITWGGNYMPWKAYWDLRYSDLQSSSWTNLDTTTTGSARWYWGYGGTWGPKNSATLTLLPVIYSS